MLSAETQSSSNSYFRLSSAVSGSLSEFTSSAFAPLLRNRCVAQGRAIEACPEGRRCVSILIVISPLPSSTWASSKMRSSGGGAYPISLAMYAYRAPSSRAISSSDVPDPKGSSSNQLCMQTRLPLREGMFAGRSSSRAACACSESLGLQ